MPKIIRVGDIVTQARKAISGPGNPDVLVNGRPISVIGDIHPAPDGSTLPPGQFTTGSSDVFVGGLPVLRTVVDKSTNNDFVIIGLPDVEIS